MVEVGNGELVENDADGEAADKLRFETELHEVLRLRAALKVRFAQRFGQVTAEANVCLAFAFADDLEHLAESAADDKEDVFGVDRLAFDLAATPLVFESGLQLRLDIRGRAERDFRFLHEFQEIGLYAATAHIASDDIGGCGNLIDLVEVNDPVAREGYIAV